MKNHRQFIINSLRILLCEIQRIEAVCTHADLAVAGPNVEQDEFNKKIHDALMFVKDRAIDADTCMSKLLERLMDND